MKFLTRIVFIFFLISSQANASNVKDWLQSEIDKILNTYKNDNISNVEKFQYVEDTINQNFAGAGIAKFVAGKAWATGDKETKETYIKSFKRHLALNIAAIMEGYSGQTYSLIQIKNDEANQVILIDMEVLSETNKILITWRVKESKNKFYVIDLIVADISLVLTKRSEFNSMLKKINYDLKILNETLTNQNELSYNKLIK
jgi:ABC-type transporter MlaC component